MFGIWRAPGNIVEAAFKLVSNSKSERRRGAQNSPRIGADAEDGLQLGTTARTIQAQVPKLKLRLVGKVSVDSSGARARDEERLARARRPGKDRRSRYFSEMHHARKVRKGVKESLRSRQIELQNVEAQW